MSKKKVHTVKSHGITPENPKPDKSDIDFLVSSHPVNTRAITMGEIRAKIDEMAREAVQQAVQQELQAIRERYQSVLPQAAQPVGEDVPDQGPSLAAAQVEITIRAEVSKYGIVLPLNRIAERIRRQLEQDEYNMFPWFEVIHEVTVVNL